MVFCESFHQVPLFTDAFAEFENDTINQKIIDNYYPSTATIAYQELWHWLYKNTINENKVFGDVVHGVKENWDLAAQYGAELTAINVDSYVLAALSLFIQNTYYKGRYPELVFSPYFPDIKVVCGMRRRVLIWMQC
jgi:hypothetical protein